MIRFLSETYSLFLIKLGNTENRLIGISDGQIFPHFLFLEVIYSCNSRVPVVKASLDPRLRL